MAKQQVSQRYIFKINSTRLRKAKWDLTLPLPEARRNEEVISLNDSQMLRWIDELNGLGNTEVEANRIKAEIRSIKQQPQSIQNRREIKRLYEELDRVQFKPDYMHLVIDKDKDLYRACRGFKINGIRYSRLLGTNGGVKNKTIVFVSERLVYQLRERIENGRDATIPQIPAKLEAYRALTCSGSTPVSMPRGILIVPDCETIFKEDVIMLNDEGVDEPEMQYIKDYEITLDESDGYGLMLPSLARRWSEELSLNYVAGGMNTRFSWEKGMVFCFDFLEFADNVANTRIVKDAWGNEVDLSNVELILTTSMVKLWNSYNSIEHYLQCCADNHYSFGVTKTCPMALEIRRNLNYQFIQSYDLDDSQVRELIQPTIDEIQGVIDGDYRQALLFLRGTHLTEEDDINLDVDHIASALMIEPRMFDDPYIKRKIYHQIENRIKRAKIGVVGVHGNYSIVCGDPYALCQNIFGLPVTGLLRAGQIYNGYWAATNATHVACFRAPMTCHNNIRKMEVARGAEVEHWYQYMTTCTLLNAWDTTSQALNGADKDGDLVMLTDNRVLVDNIRHMPTIFCAQRKGAKIEVSEDDLIRANIASFGDDIGRTTNWITSMFDVQANFPADSEEYRVLDYRIKCGQLYQQNCIDKAKGIICKPMPRSWYDRHSNKLPENYSEDDVAARDFNLRVIADKKPYFMRYIYPSLMSQYNTYIKNTRTKCMREFRMNVTELLAIPDTDRTPEQNDFIRYYLSRMPVGMNNCVMNRICRIFEEEFDGYLKLNYSGNAFDTTLMKSSSEYTRHQYLAISKLYKQHNERLMEQVQALKNGRDAELGERAWRANNLQRIFQEECLKVCSNNKQLCDLVVDVCYQRVGTQQFAWDVCGGQIINNLLDRNGFMISYPVQDDNGDISYGGQRFCMIRKRSVYGGDYFERESMGGDGDREQQPWSEAGRDIDEAG